MPFSKISQIAYYLPENILSNEDLSTLFPEGTPEKIFEMTGIRSRHVASSAECASDLAEKAAKSLFSVGQVDPRSVDFVILATNSPDYIVPATACLLQDKLGIPKTAGALDCHQACSAYVYGLALAKGLLASGTSTNVLLIMAETVTKHLHPLDKGARTAFGDAAAASLISRSETEGIGNFVLGTDGAGYRHLIIPAGGMRDRRPAASFPDKIDYWGNVRTEAHLFMDSVEMFDFTAAVIPPAVKECLRVNGLAASDIDLYVFHQAGKFLLDFLRKTLAIPKEKFYVNFSDCGNTISATIPIALARAAADGALVSGMKAMLVGFGAGLSWGATVVTW